jgi:hypothetical protein
MVLADRRITMKNTVEIRHKLADLLAEAERRKADRALAMPTEEDAMEVMCKAYQRLKDLGWKSSTYCPKHGERSMYLEAGGSRPAPGAYHGEWPTGGWFLEDVGDLWPSMPVLFRELREDE